MNVARLFLAGVWIWVASLAVGCSSPTGAGKGKYAAVELDGFSRSAVEMASEQVFEQNGFKLASKRIDTLIFERQASMKQNIIWGGWQTGLWDRAVVKITRLSESDHFLVSLDAYRVQSKDDKVLEEEKKMGFAMQPEYQHMLDKVKSLLEPLPTSKDAANAVK